MTNNSELSLYLINRLKTLYSLLLMGQYHAEWNGSQNLMKNTHLFCKFVRSYSMLGTIFNFFLFYISSYTSTDLFFYSALSEKYFHHPFAFVKGFTIIHQTILTDNLLSTAKIVSRCQLNKVYVRYEYEYL